MRHGLAETAGVNLSLAEGQRLRVLQPYDYREVTCVLLHNGA